MQPKLVHGSQPTVRFLLRNHQQNAEQGIPLHSIPASRILLTSSCILQAFGENMMGAVHAFGQHLATAQQDVAETSDIDSVFFDLGGFKMVRPLHHAS